MKTRLLALGGLVSVLAAGAAFGVHAQTGTTPAPKAPMHREKHPDIRMARRRLEGALDVMKKASTDFNGHKEKAMDLTQQAIKELDSALKSDK